LQAVEIDAINGREQSRPCFFMVPRIPKSCQAHVGAPLRKKPIIRERTAKRRGGFQTRIRRMQRYPQTGLKPGITTFHLQ